MATMDKLLSHQVGAGLSFSECSVSLISASAKTRDTVMFVFYIWRYRIIFVSSLVILIDVPSNWRSFHNHFGLLSSPFFYGFKT